MGKNEKCFTVPKCFLTKSSEFLQACCKGSWKEAQAKKIELPAVDEDLWTIYLQYLYTGDLVIDNVQEAENDEERQDGQSGQTNNKTEQMFADDIVRLIDLAALGDMFRDAAFRNVVSDAFIATIETYGFLPGPTSLHLLVKCLPNTSPLYRLNVDFFATTATPGDFERRGSAYPVQFVLDLLIEMIKQRDDSPRDEPSSHERCRYHEHNQSTPLSTNQCVGPRVREMRWGSSG